MPPVRSRSSQASAAMSGPAGSVSPKGNNAARLKAARLNAVMGFPHKLNAVSRGVRKHEHPTDRGSREDGCGA